METSAFKRNAFKTLDAKKAKEGIRTSLRKKALVNIAVSIVGVRESVDQIITGLRPYILGFQITDEQREKTATALGSALQHGVNIAKVVKVKVPPAQRKMKVLGTSTAILLDLTKHASDLFEIYVGILRGGAKDPNKVIDLEKVKASIVPFLHNAYLLSWSMLNQPAADVMEAHVARLTPLYPVDFFKAPPKKAVPPHLKKASNGTTGSADDATPGATAVPPKVNKKAKKAAKKAAAAAAATEPVAPVVPSDPQPAAP